MNLFTGVARSAITNQEPPFIISVFNKIKISYYLSRMKILSIGDSTKPDKKLMAVFEHEGRKKTVHFGARNMNDYTLTKDKEARDRYLARHSKRENWNDPVTPGALSRWILWGNSTSRTKNIAEYKKHFGL
jgi:hypothetical protein